MSSGLKVRFEATEADFLRYAAYHFRESEDARASRRRMLFFGAMALVIYAIGMKDDPNFGLARPDQFVLRVGLAAAGVIGFLLVYLRALRPLLLRGWLRKAAARGAGPATVELRADGVHVKNAEGTGTLAWEACRGVVRDKDHVYFLMGPLRAVIVPHRAFADDATAHAFIEYAHAQHTKAQAKGSV